MASRDELLREKTHKDDGLSIRERVFYTLNDGKESQPECNSKAIALLVELLAERGIVLPEKLDEMLLELAR